MKKFVTLLILTTPLLIASCSSSTNNGSSNTLSSSQNDTNTSITSQTTNSNTSTSEYIDNSKIASIKLNVNEVDVKVGSKTYQLTVTYSYNVPDSEIETVNKDVNWSSSDSSIASVDQYGRVTAKAVGSAVITCTTVEGSKKAFATIYTYDDDHPITKKWMKITSDDDLTLGGQYIFACPQEGVAAGTDDTGMYLHSESVNYSTDKNEILSVGLAARFILGNDDKREGYTLEVPEREDGTYLGATNTKKVSFFTKVNTIQVLWGIYYDTEQSCWDIRPTSNVDGWFMYDKNKDGFSIYQSNEIDHAMYVVSLYKLVSVH